MTTKDSLCIVRIQTEQELNQCFDTGLDVLYQNVFGAPPYNEVFTRAEVRAIFREFLQNAGHIYVALDAEANNKPVAFVTAIPLSATFEISALMREKVCIETTGYFAEDGVEENYRRQGVSTQMKKMLLETCAQEGFDKVVLRTSVQNYPQISAVNKAGGVALKNIFQNVARKQVNDRMMIEKNAFYLFDSTPKTVTSLNNVSIVRDTEGKDTAFLPETIHLSDDEKSSLFKTYAGISSVATYHQEGEKDIISGEEVFRGKLYFAR